MFKEKVGPIRKKIKQFENQINKAKLQKNSKKDLSAIVDEKDIKIFTESIKPLLNNLSFSVKQAIVRCITSNITANRKSLQIYGGLNLSEIYVILFSENRYRRASKCWEINPL